MQCAVVYWVLAALSDSCININAKYLFQRKNISMNSKIFAICWSRTGSGGVYGTGPGRSAGPGRHTLHTGDSKYTGLLFLLGHE